ncbi:hypothetical protein [Micromonospora nigra]|nr:hypothetical protein [Micromonospora nigra]
MGTAALLATMPATLAATCRHRELGCNASGTGIPTNCTINGRPR